MKLDLKNKNVWNEWRENYHSMTTEEQKEFHDAIEAQFPEQAHFETPPFYEALNICKPTRIVEFGGWKGDLAKIMLEVKPDIRSWKNIEICKAAILKTVCVDRRYSVIEPENFFWFSNPPFDPYQTDLVVATHFIEHISDFDFKKLVQAIWGAEWMYFEIPLSRTGSKWKGYTGTHKLTLGWNHVEDLLDKSGYRKYCGFEGYPYCKLFKLR
jgi:hypothetical protein